MNSTTENEADEFFPEVKEPSKVTVDPKAIDASDNGEAFKTRVNHMGDCPHTTPQREGEHMVCPLCGERAEVMYKDDGTSYLGY